MHSFSCIALNLTIRAGQLRATRTWIQFSSISFSRLWKIRFIHSYCFESKVTTVPKHSWPWVASERTTASDFRLLCTLSYTPVVHRYIYIYLIYCRILKYISFCSKDKWASKNGHCRSFYWRFSFIPQSWRYTGYLVDQIQALFASPKSWRWFSTMSELA